MSTIYFISGVGLGAGLCAATMLAMLRSAVRGNSEAASEHMKNTEELIRERNRLDEQKLTALAEIRQAISYK